MTKIHIELDDEDYMPVLIPSLDRRASVETISTVVSAIIAYGKNPLVILSSDSGLLLSRTSNFFHLSEILKINKARGFMIDSDIAYITGNILEYIKRADKEKVSFVAPYRIFFNGQIKYALSLNGVDVISEEEFRKLEDWQEIKAAGLGFYYGDLPLEYTFKISGEIKKGAHITGEDFNFFLDNNIKPRLAKNIVLGHLKQIVL
jgi:hypothetical protein